MTGQLQLKLEALRGARTSPARRGGLRAGRSMPAVPDRRSRCIALDRLGFSWDGSRSLWARTESLSLGHLGLVAEVMAPLSLRSLSSRVGDAIQGPVVCFDLETTGLQRGSGTVPFLYGWATVSDDRVELEQWLLPELGEEAAFVAAAHESLRRAGLLVTYNGATFDLPLVRTREVMAGLDLPWPATPHLDLLPLVRRLFRHRLVRCSLRRAEEELLRRPRQDDVPGSEAPARYRAFLRHPEASALAPVVAHNRQDLLSLIRLIAHLEQHLKGPPPHPSDWYSLGRYAEDRGNFERADELYFSAQTRSPAPLDRAAALRRSRMLRRQGHDEEARAGWEAIWERWHDPEAAEALCIDMEHRTGDPRGALRVAQTALEDAPVGWDRRFAKRVWRLEARLGGAGRNRDRPSSDPPEASRVELDPSRPWASWLPGGASYAAWVALQRGRGPGGSDRSPWGRAEALMRSPGDREPR